MKPKGWRNDPRWIEFYEQREKEHVERQLIRIKTKFLDEQIRRHFDETARLVPYEPPHET